MTRSSWMPIRCLMVSCALIVASCSSTATETATPRGVLDGFVAAVDAGDASMALAGFAAEATWSVDELELALAQPLPADLGWLASAFRLADDATGFDVVAAWVELLVAAETDLTVASCSGSGGQISCDYAMLDLLASVTGGGERGRMTVVADGGEIVRMSLVTSAPTEPIPTADAFRRWAAIEDVASMRVMPLLDSTRLGIALVRKWESAGRPDVTPPAVGSDDPIARVEAWLQARNRGDWPALVALTGGEALMDPFASRDEFDAAQLLDRVITPTSCSVQLEGSSTGAFVACDVVVTDIIVEAAGTTSSNLNQSTFRVLDGRVVAVPQYLPSSFVAEQAIEAWAQAERSDEYAASCPDGIAGQSAIDGLACARFIADSEPGWRPVVAGLGLVPTDG